jgi:hypothetical protein
MKKVGILTLPLIDNYGGMLQAVALYCFLEERGFNVVLLRNEFLRKRSTSWIWTLIERIPFHNFKGVRYVHLKKMFHEEFLRKYLMKRTQPIKSMQQFAKLSKQERFDAIVVGSDQVWRWDYMFDGYERYFLSFADNTTTRKIAYAASFGKTHWQASEKKNDVAAFLKDFHAVSTRESHGVAICEELGRFDCQQVLDPTLLIDRSFYDRMLIKSSLASEKKTLLTYVLDEHGEKLNFINQIHKELGSEYLINSFGLHSDKTVPEWVTAFHDADYVITDSFHGMVLSIIFNKQFVVIGNSSRGLSRFTSLLEQFEIKERLVDEQGLSIDSAVLLTNSKINFEFIQSKLHLFRKQSSDFLLNALS